jgi:uncharacterized protein YqeY
VTLQQRLKADLGAARRHGDAQATAVIRTLLAALANAEAVPLGPDHPKEVQGWAEAPRRRLDADDIDRILQREAAELRAAADEYAARGRDDEAVRLRRHADLVDGYRD